VNAHFIDYSEPIRYSFPRAKSRRRKAAPPQEFKIVSIRDSLAPQEQWLCETPEHAVTYWRTHVAEAPWYSPDRECAVAILLNCRQRILGHHLISIGLLDSVVLHPRETFRAAVISAAHSLILAHNHPSGDPTPSGADIVVTRDAVRAGECLKIRVLDHVIIGSPNFCSLRQLGVLD
jgi:DNA repair protein RadC